MKNKYSVGFKRVELNRKAAAILRISKQDDFDEILSELSYKDLEKIALQIYAKLTDIDILKNRNINPHLIGA